MAETENVYMSMSNTSFGPSTLPKNVRIIDKIQTRKINDVSDIDGARPANKFCHARDKPDFTSNLDIFGSVPKILHRTTNAPDNTLNVDDIDGARHHISDRMLTTNRHTNPLNPDYKLPTFNKPDPYMPKFIRDAHDVSDIDGAQPTLKKQWQPRETFPNDIEGAQANWRPRHRRVRLEAPPIDNMYVEDICKRTHRYVDRTSRVTDVVDPVYKVHGMIIADDPRFSKPKKLKSFIPDSKLLQTADIPGATVGWGRRERTEIRNLTSTADIPGAQADTIKHSIISTRNTNPLNPVYKSLDYGEPLPGPIQPLLPASITKVIASTV